MLPRTWFALGHGAAGAFLWWFLPELCDKVPADDAAKYGIPPALILPFTFLTHYGFNSYILLIISSTFFTLNQMLVFITQLMYGTYLRHLDLLNLPVLEILTEVASTAAYGYMLWSEVYAQYNQHYVEPIYPHGVAEYRLEKKIDKIASGERGRVNYLNCSYFAVDVEEEIKV